MVTLSDHVPKTLLFDVHWPGYLRTFGQYLIMVSPALAILNICPAFFLDGQVRRAHAGLSRCMGGPIASLADSY